MAIVPNAQPSVGCDFRRGQHLPEWDAGASQPTMQSIEEVVPCASPLRGTSMQLYGPDALAHRGRGEMLPALETSPPPRRGCRLTLLRLMFFGENNSVRWR